MKTFKFSKAEMKNFNFHLTVISFHRQVIENYVKQIATTRLGIKPGISIRWNLNKGELYLEDKSRDKPKKLKKKK